MSMEEATNSCSQNEVIVKEELTEEESMTSWMSYGGRPKFKEEIKTEDDYFGHYQETEFASEGSDLTEEVDNNSDVGNGSDSSGSISDARLRPKCSLRDSELGSPNSIQKSKSFKCSKCQGCFTTKQSLDIHILSVHDKLEPFKCLNCSSAFSRKDKLNEHTKTVHEKLKPLKCPSCDNEFSQKGNLARHILSVHEKLKKFKCPKCDYACICNGILSRHIRTVHEKVKPFKCSKCNYACTVRYRLTRHLKTHNKLK